MGATNLNSKGPTDFRSQTTRLQPSELIASESVLLTCIVKEIY